MQITTTEVDFCKLSVHYTEDDATAIADKRNEIALKFKGKKMPGYRLGNATIEAAKVYYKAQIKDSLVEQLANDAFQNTISEKQLKPCGQPQFSSYELNGGKFSCDFTMHTYPDFVLGQYKEFEIPKQHQTETSDQIAQSTLQDLRVKLGETTPYTEDQFVQIGDSVILTYSGFLGETKIDRLSAENETVAVGKTAIPGFDDQLLGMKQGDEKSFTVTFPEQMNDGLSGKEVRFDVKVVLGAKITPAPLNDEFAVKLGLKTIQEVMDATKVLADNRLKEAEDAHYYNQISGRLVDGHNFKVPAWLSSAEAQFSAKRSGSDWEKLTDAQKERFVEAAEKSIRLSLVLNAVREEWPDAALSAEEGMKLLRDNLAKYSTNVDEALKTLYNNGQLAIMLNRVKDDFALQAIKKSCMIIE